MVIISTWFEEEDGDIQRAFPACLYFLECNGKQPARTVTQIPNKLKSATRKFPMIYSTKDNLYKILEKWMLCMGFEEGKLC
jgi:hypothetical protein